MGIASNINAKWTSYLSGVKASGNKFFPGIKVVPPKESNLYTGLRPSAGFNTIATIGAAAWAIKSTGTTLSDFTDNGRKNAGVDTGYLPMMGTEGKGNMVNGEDYLGEMADTVFFLHNIDKRSKIR